MMHEMHEKMPEMHKKMPKTYEGKSTKPGGGGRFAMMVDALKGKVDNPGAVAAAIGRRKYGKKKFGTMAAKGRRRMLAEKLTG